MIYNNFDKSKMSLYFKPNSYIHIYKYTYIYILEILYSLYEQYSYLLNIHKLAINIITQYFSICCEFILGFNTLQMATIYKFIN